MALHRSHAGCRKGYGNTLKPYRSITLLRPLLSTEGLTLTEMKILYCELTQSDDPPKFDTEEEASSAVEPLLQKAIKIVNDPNNHKMRGKVKRRFTGRIKSTCDRFPDKELLMKVLSLPGGATLAECMATTGWTYTRCHNRVIDMHTKLGYGLEEDENRKIQLVYE